MHPICGWLGGEEEEDAGPFAVLLDIKLFLNLGFVNCSAVKERK